MTIRSALGRSAGLRRGHRGSALVAILISVLMCAAVVMTALLATSTSAALSRGALSRVQSLCAAESGAERAVWELTHGDRNWTGWTPLADDAKQLTAGVADEDGNELASFTVTVSDPSRRNITVQSTGVRTTGYDGALIERQVDVRLELVRGGWFQWALYGTEYVEFKDKAEVDAYDSSQGPYASSASSDAQIAGVANGANAIKINNDALLKGDAYCHPDADPDIAIVGPITGTRNNINAICGLPSVPVPTDITVDMDKWKINNTTYMLDQDIKCKQFQMAGNAVLQVQGNRRLYLYGSGNDGKSKLNGNAEIRIPDGSSLSIYVGGKEFKIEGNARINTQGEDPTRCIFYGLPSLEKKLDMKGSSVIYALIYIPDGWWRATDRAEFFGSAIGKVVKVKKDCHFHYDKALAGHTIPHMPEYPGGPAGGSSDALNILSWKVTR